MDCYIDTLKSVLRFQRWIGFIAILQKSCCKINNLQEMHLKNPRRNHHSIHYNLAMTNF